jgi:hypothetical protein
MSAPTDATSMPIDPVEERQKTLPKADKLGMLTLALLLSAGVYMAANTSRPASLLPAQIAAGLAALLLITNAILVLRVKDFARDKFFLVFRWALLAYGIMAGILEFVFVFDHTPQNRLILLTALLLMFALDVPLMLAFAVARYQPTASDNAA